MQLTPPRTVRATRYVSALRSGSSVPIVVEADDDGLYVLKLRGSGQGVAALIAELVAATLGRALGLPIPEIVLAEFAPMLAAVERDAELRDLYDASSGLNVGLDYLPGAVAFDSLRHTPPPPELAARIVVFDLFLMNVDRQHRPSNVLVWHDDLYLIDHGAALAFQYDWDVAFANPAVTCPLIRHHVLLPFAGPLPEAAPMLAQLDDAGLRATLAAVPDGWLTDAARFATPDRQRTAYVEFLARRRDATPLTYIEAAEDLRTHQ